MTTRGRRGIRVIRQDDWVPPLMTVATHNYNGQAPWAPISVSFWSWLEGWIRSHFHPIYAFYPFILLFTQNGYAKNQSFSVPKAACPDRMVKCIGSGCSFSLMDENISCCSFVLSCLWNLFSLRFSAEVSLSLLASATECIYPPLPLSLHPQCNFFKPTRYYRIMPKYHAIRIRQEDRYQPAGGFLPPKHKKRWVTNWQETGRYYWHLPQFPPLLCSLPGCLACLCKYCWTNQGTLIYSKLYVLGQLRPKHFSRHFDHGEKTILARWTW